MKNTIEIINRIDELFNPASGLSQEQIKAELLQLRREIGDDLFVTCWVVSHRVLAGLADTYRLAA